MVPIRLRQEFATQAKSTNRCERLLAYELERLKEVGLRGSVVGTVVNPFPKFQDLVVRDMSKNSGQALRATDDLL
jgi:aspartate ammonia-lyase